MTSFVKGVVLNRKKVKTKVRNTLIFNEMDVLRRKGSDELKNLAGIDFFT
jgi:hypothetical protein